MNSTPQRTVVHSDGRLTYLVISGADRDWIEVHSALDGYLHKVIEVFENEWR
jgi:hypothetical protein